MNPVILLDEVDKVGADWRATRQRAARGARPGAEPHVPRPLPRGRPRPVRGGVHRHGQRGRHDPRRRCSTAWSSSASTATPRTRRSSSPATTCSPASVERTGLQPDEVVVDDDALARSSATTPARPACARSSASSASCCARSRPRIAGGDAQRPVVDRRRRRPRVPRPAEGRRRGRRADRGARRGHRPGRHRRRRRRAVHRGDARWTAASRRPDPHRPARRRHEGVGADRAVNYVRSHADELGIDRERCERPVPRPRAGGRGAQGRPVRRRHDDDRARLAADRPPGASRRSG